MGEVAGPRTFFDNVILVYLFRGIFFIFIVLVCPFAFVRSQVDDRRLPSVDRVMKEIILRDIVVTVVRNGFR